MQVAVNLGGIRFHVGFYHNGKTYQVDKNDVYVTNEAGDFLNQIDDPDTIGELRHGYGWVSLTFLAEELADTMAATWDRDTRVYEREMATVG